MTIEEERRTGIRRFTDRPITPRQILRALAVPFLVAAVTWAARTMAPAIAMPERFARDSAWRDHELARRDTILNRVDLRVGVIYCSGLPLQKQAGCR